MINRHCTCEGQHTELFVSTVAFNLIFSMAAMVERILLFSIEENEGGAGEASGAVEGSCKGALPGGGA